MVMPDFKRSLNILYKRKINNKMVLFTIKPNLHHHQ